jgi:hypothetical protein
VKELENMSNMDVELNGTYNMALKMKVGEDDVCVIAKCYQCFWYFLQKFCIEGHVVKKLSPKAAAGYVVLEADSLDETLFEILKRRYGARARDFVYVRVDNKKWSKYRRWYKFLCEGKSRKDVLEQITVEEVLC